MSLLANEVAKQDRNDMLLNITLFLSDRKRFLERDFVSISANWCTVEIWTIITDLNSTFFWSSGTWCWCAWCFYKNWVVWQVYTPWLSSWITVVVVLVLWTFVSHIISSNAVDREIYSAFVEDFATVDSKLEFQPMGM